MRREFAAEGAVGGTGLEDGETEIEPRGLGRDAKPSGEGRDTEPVHATPKQNARGVSDDETPTYQMPEPSVSLHDEDRGVKDDPMYWTNVS